MRTDEQSHLHVLRLLEKTICTAYNSSLFNRSCSLEKLKTVYLIYDVYNLNLQKSAVNEATLIMKSKNKIKRTLRDVAYFGMEKGQTEGQRSEGMGRFYPYI